MAHIHTMTAFTPKQAASRTPETLAEIMGNISYDTVLHVLQHDMEPLSPGDIIHDNGCGPGTASQAILSLHPAGLTIHGTDLNPQLLEVFEEIVGRTAQTMQNVTTSAEVMNAEDLTFEDETFSHSFSSFLIGAVQDRHKFAAQLHRTLKVGGKAVVIIAEDMPHDRPLKDAHAITRGPDARLLVKWPTKLLSPTYVANVLVSGGFREESIKAYSIDMFREITDLKRWSTLLWSFICMREGEAMWFQEDEDKWEEAVGIIMKGLQESELTTREGDKWILRFPMTIAIATK